MTLLSLHASDECSLFWCTTPMVSLLLSIRHSQCLRLTITQLAKQGNCAVAVDLSQINANTLHVYYRC